MRRMLNRSRTWWASLTVGGTMLVLSGCEPEVRDTVLSGVESAAAGLAAAFISAFFQTLDQPEDAGMGTVRVILEQLQDVIA